MDRCLYIVFLEPSSCPVIVACHANNIVTRPTLARVFLAPHFPHGTKSLEKSVGGGRRGFSTEAPRVPVPLFVTPPISRAFIIPTQANPPRGTNRTNTPDSAASPARDSFRLGTPAQSPQTGLLIAGCQRGTTMVRCNLERRSHGSSFIRPCQNNRSTHQLI